MREKHRNDERVMSLIYKGKYLSPTISGEMLGAVATNISRPLYNSWERIKADVANSLLILINI